MLQGLSLREERLIGNRRHQSSHVGLKLLIATSKEKKPNNILMKPAVKSVHRSSRIFSELCYLKRCHLCKKKLRQDKDVYMYRGDLGFCTVECRDRQILMDERDEFEVSTKRLLANSGAGKTETQILLEDLRRRHRRHVPKSFIVPLNQSS
ncbi:PREDICTED: uncharacterized protein LOC104810583 [Tarenaya hassleriana]|uniref:uncharacterized protein LOC104810583 n=1 Tax=Tarenaya hassleriana TaxID=28532 RepID=UPI00053C3466|nr:PREDICTED: uncharacterized protein LOC104810583 [Tarenaya hassleriana]